MVESRSRRARRHSRAAQQAQARVGKPARNIAAVAVVMAIALVWPPPVGEPEPPPCEQRAEATATRATPRPGRREVVVAPAQQAASPAAAPQFAALLERLVDLALRVDQELSAGDQAAARSTDDAARAVFAQLLAEIPDAAEQALSTLPEQVAADPRARARRDMLGRLLRASLAQRHEQARAGAPRRALDGLVDGLLAALVPIAANGELIADLLVDQPYLDLPHEDQLLRLTELSNRHAWLPELTRSLLLTLWHNLEARGVRSAGEAETLAMLLENDSNPARRAAAVERLIASGNPRFVEFVLADLERRGDRDRARAVAMVAAQRLPARQALEVVQRLVHTLGEAMAGPALLLSNRDAAAVRSCYERLLGDDRDAALRAELITGVGFHASPENLDLVLTALRLDPDPTVRSRALLAATGAASAAHGEAAVEAALADQQLIASPGGYHAIVAAIDNLARAGERNAVARLRQRLAGRVDVPESARQRLADIVAKHIPAGH